MHDSKLQSANRTRWCAGLVYRWTERGTKAWLVQRWKPSIVGRPQNVAYKLTSQTKTHILTDGICTGHYGLLYPLRRHPKGHPSYVNTFKTAWERLLSWEAKRLYLKLGFPCQLAIQKLGVCVSRGENRKILYQMAYDRSSSFFA